jgi:DNA invertase Pin-like site-specific DNA recombinase
VAETPKRLVRAGCYLRISSDPEDKREGTQRQREDTATLCEVQGWTIADVYPDDDRSASNGKDRPEWKRLLDDIKAGKIDAIAAWDQDRNWRMMSELEELRRFFTSLGRKVELATTGQGVIDLYSPTGVLMAQIKTAVSEHEIAMMRVRQLRAARQRAEQGRPQWKRAFGYHPDTRDKKQDDGTRRINRKQRDLVKAAYKAVISDDEKARKLTAIVDKWNKAGVRGLNGEPWSVSTLSLFLRSPRNAGLRSHNGQIVMDGDGRPVKGTWPPLVTEELWRAAQTVLSKNAHAPKSVDRHLLTGVMRCGREGCGGYLGGNWQRPAQTEPHSAIRLSKTNHIGHVITYTCKSCRGVSVRAEHVEPVVIGTLIKRLARPDAVKLLRKKVFDPAVAEKLDAEEAILRAKLVQLGRDFATAPPEFTAAAVSDVNTKLDAIERKRQDQERRRVLDDIPLGTDRVAEKVGKLSPDRLRAVINALMIVTVKPVGKGNKVFNAKRIDVKWK